MFYPTVRYYFRGHPSSKHITRLIVMYLAPPLPASIVDPVCCPVFNYKISFDDKWLATYNQPEENEIKLWRLENNTTTHATLLGHRNHVNDLIFTSDNQHLISASDDFTLIIWSVRTGNRLRTFRGHTGGVMRCSLTRNNQRMLSDSYDDTVRIWVIETGECIATIGPFRKFHLHLMMRPKFCNHDQHIIIPTYINIQLWTVTGRRRLLRKVDTPYAYGYRYVTRFLELDEVRFLFTETNHHTVQVWEFAGGTCLQTFRGHDDLVESALFVQEKTGVVSCDINHTLYIWRVGDGICTHQFHNYAMLSKHNVKYWLEAENTEAIIVITPNAVHILAVHLGEIIFTFPIQTGRMNHELIQVSFDGQFLVWKDGCIVRFLVIAHHKNITHN